MGGSAVLTTFFGSPHAKADTSKAPETVQQQQMDEEMQDAAVATPAVEAVEAAGAEPSSPGAAASDAPQKVLLPFETRLFCQRAAEILR